jgi:hypothetical protein
LPQDFSMVETTPVVWKGQLLRFESVRGGYGQEPNCSTCGLQKRDPASEQRGPALTPPRASCRASSVLPPPGAPTNKVCRDTVAAANAALASIADVAVVVVVVVDIVVVVVALSIVLGIISVLPIRAASLHRGQ